MSRITKTFRINESLDDKLECLSYEYGISQTDVIEYGISLISKEILSKADNKDDVVKYLSELDRLRYELTH